MNDLDKSRFERKNEKNFKIISYVVQYLYLAIMVFIFGLTWVNGIVFYLTSFLVKYIAYKIPTWLIGALNNFLVWKYTRGK